MDETTHFGFTKVSPEEKTKKVKGVFNAVALKYDLMNDLMSLGLHRLWKRYAISALRIKAGHQILDLAGGTADLTKLILQKSKLKEFEPPCHVMISDINSAMLAQGICNLADAGLVDNVDVICNDAEQLPFDDHFFDRIIIGFGLRNVTNKFNALKEMYRTLKAGGQAMILEFSHPTHPLLASIYDQYSFKILPKLGEIIAKDKDAYQYLAESIRMHPDQEGLKHLIQKAGFDECKVTNLLGGIVAIHQGFKY